MDKKAYKKNYRLIESYIKCALKSDKQINEYVPNSHVAEVIKDVLIYLELENMYPDQFHGEVQITGEEWSSEKGTVYTTSNYKTDFHILDHILNDNYFDNELLIKNGTEEIHRVYQKLRDKHDNIRNTMKISNIYLKNIIMPHKYKRDLKAHKIKIN